MKELNKRSKEPRHRGKTLSFSPFCFRLSLCSSLPFQTDGKYLLRLKGREQNSSLLVSPLKDLNLSHQCFPRSFLIEESFLCNVLSKKKATLPATKGSEENGTFTISLNCQICKRKRVSLVQAMLKSNLRYWLKRWEEFQALIDHSTKNLLEWKEKKKITVSWLLHTQRAPVWTGPYPLIAVYSLKY